MTYRSWLVVPAHSEKRLGKAVGAGADAIVIDLVESDALVDRETARARAAEWLEAHRSHVVERPVGRWVRINSFENGAEWRNDLHAVMPSAPDGIILPDCAGPDAVRQLAAEIYEIEQRLPVVSNSTGIIPVVGETARAALTIAHYCEGAHQRLSGLSLGSGGLAEALGASRTQDSNGRWTDAIAHVRAQTLLTAHACEIPAIDSASTSALDDGALEDRARAAAGDGFAGMFAFFAEQVATINDAFTPGDGETGDDARSGLKIVSEVSEGARLTVGKSEPKVPPILRPA